MTEWEPTAAHLTWQRSLLASISHMGVWGVPITESIFQVNQVTKTLTLQAGNANDETNQRIIKCCDMCGYTFATSKIEEN